jgi:hypothetical protein
LSAALAIWDISLWDIDVNEAANQENKKTQPR